MSEEVLTGDIINDDDDEVECITGDFESSHELAETRTSLASKVVNLSSSTPRLISGDQMRELIAKRMVRVVVRSKPNQSTNSQRSIAPKPSSEINIQRCQLCGQVFLNQSLLIHHMESYHNVDKAHVLKTYTGSSGTSTQAASKRVSSSSVPAPGGFNATNNPALEVCQITTSTTFTGSALYGGDQSDKNRASEFISPAVVGKGFVCKVCWRSFTTLELIETHIALTHFTEHACSVCGEHFLDLDLLTAHMECVHNKKRISALGNTASVAETEDEPDSILPSTPKSPEVIEIFDDDSGNGDEPIVIEDKSNEEHRANDPSVDSVPEELDNRGDQVYPSEYLKHVSKDGRLTESQIKFANEMIETGTEAGVTFAVCRICRKTLSSPFHARNHIRHIHLLEKFKCCVCGKLFHSKTNRAKHQAAAHRKLPPQQSVTIISSKIYVNQAAAPSKNTSQTPATAPENGIHPNDVSAHIVANIAPSAKHPGQWECKRCRKVFKAQAHCISHCRQSHYSKSHQCNSCGYFFEDVRSHRLTCSSINNVSSNIPAAASNAEGTSQPQMEPIATVERLARVMQDYVSYVPNSTKVGSGAYRCRLCAKHYGTKFLAESHLWIDHFRSVWVQECGQNKADAVYMEYLKAHIEVNSDTSRTCQDSSSGEASSDGYVYAGSINNMRIRINSDNNASSDFMGTGLDSQQQQSGMEEDSAFSGPIIVGNPISMRNSSISSEDQFASFDASQQCKVEFSEAADAYYDESMEDGDNLNEVTANSHYPTEPSEVAVESYRQDLPKSAERQKQSSFPVPGQNVKEVDIMELNKKALRFIKEKSGKFYCIVCQEVSKLRTLLVDHVRDVHLISNPDASRRPPTSELRRAADPDARLSCSFCDEEFNSVITRESHEHFCVRTSPAYTDRVGSLGRGPQSVSKTSATERAMKYTQPDGREFCCTVCGIRATMLNRLLRHIIVVHFGDDNPAVKVKDVHRCGACGKVFEKASTKNRHASQCKIAKLKSFGKSLRMMQKTTMNSGSAGSKLLPEARNVSGASESKGRSNFVIGPNGLPTKKRGRPFANPDVYQPAEKRPVNQHTIALEALRARFGKTCEKKSDTSSKDSTASDRTESNELQDTASAEKPDVSGPEWDPDEKRKAGVVPYKVGEKYSFLKCSICDVLITGIQNAQDHLKKFHGGETLFSCTKCEAAFLDGTARDEHQEHAHQDNNDAGDSNPMSPDVCSGEDFESGVETADFPTISASTAALEHATPPNANCPEPSHSRQLKDKGAVSKARNIVKKYTTPKKAHTAGTKSNESPLSGTLRTVLIHSQVANPESPEDGAKSNNSDAEYRLNYESNQNTVMKMIKKLKTKPVRYECKKCGLQHRKSFRSLLHVRVEHLEEKPYQCCKCDARFTASRLVKKHYADCVQPLGQAKNPENASSRINAVVAVANLRQMEEKVEQSTKTVEKMQCKLCKELLNDIPMMRYHLVSVHYSELQAMGKAEKLFDEKEKIAEDLSVYVKEEMLETGHQHRGKAYDDQKTKQSSDKEVSLTLSDLLATSPGISSEQSTNKAKRVVKAPAAVATKKDSKPIKVHICEKALLKLISSRVSKSLKKDIIRSMTKRCTVRLEPLKCQFPLSESLLKAAHRICERVSPHLIICRLCSKECQTYSGCFRHVKILHFGEYRGRCQYCKRAITEKIKEHERSCVKRNSATSSSLESSEVDNIATETSKNTITDQTIEEEEEAGDKLLRVSKGSSNEASTKSSDTENTSDLKSNASSSTKRATKSRRKRKKPKAAVKFNWPKPSS